jgi:hypothetical protein
MIDVIVNQSPLGLADGLFDGMQLLGEIEARSSFAEHFNHPAEMTVRPLQPLDDIGMGFMNVILRHIRNVSPPGGYGNRRSCRRRGKEPLFRILLERLNSR